MSLRKRFVLPLNLLALCCNGLIALATFLLLASTASAQRLPLPPHEQEAVNSAIDSGVSYLKRTQQKNGTWVDPRARWAQVSFHGHVYAIGYTALPGLTLLECGVPEYDPIIQQAANFVRSKAATLDRTYELSLAILFLDRLGDPKDKKLIQTFALRLIAGQSATGGWGYKCPLLNNQTQKELLTALRRPEPEDMPSIAERRGKKPDQLNPIARVPGAPQLDNSLARPNAPALEATVVQPGSPPLSGSVSRGSPGESSSLSGSTSQGGEKESLSQRGSIAESPKYRPDCLGLGILDEKNPEHLQPIPKPLDKADSEKTSDAKAGPRKSTKKSLIPERIKRLPVMQDPALLNVQDPLDRPNETFLTTTDNSNTQFAILALWRAQHHDLPMKRSLNLIARRYVTSQNADGSWGYHYQFGGGGVPIRLPNAMICVGLIGLAVGHGLAQPKPAGEPVQDARIVNGLIALSGYIGEPVENRGKLPMLNLYFLWSLERVAVLYNLPTIGDKDWYRWGAQALVRNQASDGNWASGLYIGSSPPLDTCLALLFLKRANLVKDLTAKLPFKPDELNSSIIGKLTPTSKQTELPKPTKKPNVPVELSKQTEPDSTRTHSRTAPETPVEADSSTANSGKGKKKWAILSLIFFAICTGGSVIFLFAARRRNKDGNDIKDDRPKKRTIKGKNGPTSQ